MPNLELAVMCLDMSLAAAKHTLRDEGTPLQRRLTWLGGELERLASEAYRLADEAGDDAGSPPQAGDFCLCRKVPCDCAIGPP